MFIVTTHKTKLVAPPKMDGPNHIGGHYAKAVHKAMKRLCYETDLNMKQVVLALLLRALAEYKIPLEG